MSDEKTNKPTSHTRIRRGQGKRFTKEQRTAVQAAFLQVFADTANIRISCEAIGIDRSTFYQWLEHDTEFSVAYHQKELDANDALLAAAWERGVRGIEEPLVSMGQVVYEYEPALDDEGKQKYDSKGKPTMQRVAPITKRVYSDSVLLRLMSWRIPGFSEKTQDVNVNVNNTVTDLFTDLRMLSNEQLATLESWLLEAKQKQAQRL